MGLANVHLNRRQCLAVLAALAIPAYAQTLYPQAPGRRDPRAGVVRPPVRARHAMVAGPDEVATRVGVEVLKQGGNAVDAAVAVGFAMAVTFPEAGNIAGGGFALIHMADGRSSAVDYREQAPSAARAGMFSSELERWFGYRSLGVPGTLAALGWMHQQYGVKPWAAVLEPARRLAQNGSPLSPRMANTLQYVSMRMRDYPDVARIFQPGGRVPEEGYLLRQPELAATIATLQKLGWREFYEGELARRIVQDIRGHGALITFEDWKSYRPGILTPARGAYRGYPVLTMPPSTWGGIGVLEMLNILERFPLAPEQRNSAAAWHLIIEAQRRAYFDRDRWYRKPGLEPGDPAVLVSKEYAARTAAGIRPGRATPSAELGPPQPPSPAASEQTTHFSIIDAQGNVVTNTYTHQGALGALVIPKGTGVLISSGMSYFNPGCRCENEIGPGKRAIYSMTPTLVMDQQGQPWLALGAPGDYTIPAMIVQVIVNIIDFRLSIADAVDAPRILHHYLPDIVYTEPGGFSPDTAEKLKALGHQIQVRSRPFGYAPTVMVEPQSGWRLGWYDGRVDGLAAGY